jgi:hypothetical protein
MGARLLFIGITNECDDRGAFEWKPVTLKMRVLPADNVDVPSLLAELCAVDMIRPYEMCGRRYGAVRNFRQFQRPKKPNYVHPMPELMIEYSGKKPESSEPDEDDGGPSSPPVPHQTGTDGENPSQMDKVVGVGGVLVEERKNPQQPSAASPPEASPRGTRLPKGWAPSAVGFGLAVDLGLDPRRVLERFTDHWQSKAGSAARKIDWEATWRNWCREDADRAKRLPKPKGDVRWIAEDAADLQITLGGLH